MHGLGATGRQRFRSETHFNRWDVCSAWFLYLEERHNGIGCPMYERLCKLQTYFKPGVHFGCNSLTENGRAIYEQLTAGDHD